MNPKSILSVDKSHFKGKKVLVRVDFNVPMDEHGNITSDHRIRECLPNIEYLLDAGAQVILLAHFGRPKGKVDLAFTLAPVGEKLAELMPNHQIGFIPETEPEKIKQAVLNAAGLHVLLLENTRFFEGEEKNSPETAQLYASLGDIFVNDAFGAAHRGHASTEGIAHAIGEVYSGLLMNKELEYLSKVLQSPERPLVAIIGGSKISTKIAVLENLANVVDQLVIGGGMVYTFLKAQGYEVGTSICEPDFVDTAKAILEKMKSLNKPLWMPTDFVVTPEYTPEGPTQVVAFDKIPSDQMSLDMGPESRESLKQVLAKAKMVVWNGPVGVFEMPAFANGTTSCAQVIAQLTKTNALVSILGGGDTQAAVEVSGLTNADFSHVSTGGGASLEYLEGKTLPGIAALLQVQQKQLAGV